MEMKSTLPNLLLLLLVALICNQVDAAATSASNSSSISLSENESAVESSARKHKHRLMFILGGLKSVATVVLIKIQIVLVFAAIVAVSMFTVKYLMGMTILPSLPFFHTKANNLIQTQTLAQPPLTHQYLPVEHETYYGYDYSSPTPWDYNSHENYGKEWSKVEHGRNLFDLTSYLNLDENFSKNTFNVKRKKNKTKTLK